MSLTDEQKKLLEAPLSSANVKTRKKGSFTLSYLEGWVAISEANRIFGFDGWSRETVYCKEVSRQETKIGQAQKAGWKVGYEAMVRIVVTGEVWATIREGTGHGSGTMQDLFDCIESAAKESETDAMKRALMTFGNPFGLALYDKEQRNVSRDGGLTDQADQRMADNVGAYADKVADLPRNEQEWEDWAKIFETIIDSCNKPEEVDASLKGAKTTLEGCKKVWRDKHEHLLDYAEGRRVILETPTRDTPNTRLGGG